MEVAKSRDLANIKRFFSQEARSIQSMILELALARLCRKPSRRFSDQFTKVKGQRGPKRVLQRYVCTLRYVSDAESALPDPQEKFRQQGDRSATLAASIIPGRTFVAARTFYIVFPSKDLVRRLGAFFGAFLGANVTRPARPDIGSAGQGICQEMNLRLWPSREFPFVDHL